MPLTFVDAALARLAGILLLVGGTGVAMVALMLVRQMLTEEGTAGLGLQSALAVVSVVTGVGLFLMGYRLAFIRPNRHGSLLPPAAWAAMAVCFVLIGIWMGSLHHFEVWRSRGGSMGIIGCLVLAVMCWRARQAARLKA